MYAQLLFGTPTNTSKRSGKDEQPIIRQCDLQLIAQLLRTPSSLNSFLFGTITMVSELYTKPTGAAWSGIDTSRVDACVERGMDYVHQCADAVREMAKMQVGVALSQAICFLMNGYPENANTCISSALTFAKSAGYDLSFGRSEKLNQEEQALEAMINRLIAASAMIEFEEKRAHAVA